MISTYSFFDELDKIAASKWRAMLRAGKLTSGAVSKLKAAPRPGGGALLDTAREVAGLETGTTNIAKRLGANLHTVTSDSVKENLRGALTSPEARGRLGHDLMGLAVAPAGGGAAAVPAMNTAYFTPQLSMVQAGSKDPALTALLRRHEVDELRAARRARQTGVGKVFTVGIAPETPAQKILAAQQGLQRRLYGGAAGIAERVQGAGLLPKPIRQTAKTVAEQARALESAQPKPGTVMAGRHMSPFPVLQESGHTAFLPENVAETMYPFRRGENEMLGRFGFHYGVAPGETQQILRAHERGRL